MFRPENEKEDCLMCITENCGRLIEQTYTKPQQTVEIRLTQPRETFSFSTQIFLGHKSNCLVGFTCLEV